MLNIESAKIIFDASPLRYLHTGLGQFSFCLLKEFEKLARNDFDLFALVHSKYQSLVPAGIQIEKATFLRRHSPELIQKLLYRRYNLWHITTENTRLTGIPRSAQIILTIHGLHFLDEKNDVTAGQHLAKVQRLVDKAKAITAVSHFTANLVKQKLNVRDKTVEVIYNGISFADGPPTLPSWAPDGKFIFSIGTFFQRKNLGVLLPIMNYLPDFKLVLAGDDHQPQGDFIRAEIVRLGLQARVIITGEITEGEKIWLYRQGEALVFPSISEGFGIPLIESFYYGKPVFCGRYGSLPEVGAEHAFYWENFDPVQMSAMVLKKLDEDRQEKKLARMEYARRFSWNNTAKQFLNLYGRMLKKTQP